MNNETIIAKIKQLEEDLQYWKEAHVKLQASHIKLQKAVYNREAERWKN